MDIKEYLKDHIVLLDGSMGTMLQRSGLKPGEGTEEWNLTHPEDVKNVLKAYYDAGSNIVIMNTFGVNALKYKDEEKLKELIFSAYEIADAARKESTGSQEKFVAFNIGPLGAFLEPFGDLEYEDAREAFAKAVRIGAETGADLIMIETMIDTEEARAAVTAAKENSSLPVFVSHTYNENGRILTGADPKTVVEEMQKCGADAVGVNCSYGPKMLGKIAEEYLKYASVPVYFKPNAGLPAEKDGQLIYDVDAKEFAKDVAAMVKKGVRLAGGCCGTDPGFIRALKEITENMTGEPGLE